MVLPTAWPFLPNWADGITERLSWLTAIQTSRTGAEQRQALRIAPRRQIDFPVVLTDQERSYFDILMMRNSGVAWNVPLPHEEIPVGYVLPGDTTFTVDTAYREIGVGSKLLLRGADAFHSELVEVTSLTADTITTTAVDRPYTAATLTPTFLGMITEKTDTARRTGRVFTSTVRFNSIAPMMWPVTVRSLTPVSGLSHLGYPVLRQQPNAINDLTYTFERMWSVVDNSQSSPRYIDKAQRAFTSQQYEWFLYGRQERQEFRDMLMLLQGRCKPVWVPTFNDDLAAGSQGYPDPQLFGGALPPGREYVAAFFRNGTITIIGNSRYGDDGIPPDVFEGDTIYRKSFVSLKRLDVDDIEIVHQTAADGVATVSALFRDAPDLRVPASLVTQGYPLQGFFPPGGGLAVPATNASTGLTDSIMVTGSAGGF